MLATRAVHRLTVFVAAVFVLLPLPLTCSASIRPNAPSAAREQSQIDPQANAEVYVLYLRARALEAHMTNEDLRAARDLYEQAIALDRTFALAYARLSITLSGLQETPADKVRARTEAEEALRLDPRLGEGHFALAVCLHNENDDDGAVKEIDLALQTAPNDSQIVYLAASLHRRKDKWSQSLAEFQKALALDPRNLNAPTDLAYHLSQMRNWTAATQAWDRAIAITPEWYFNKICRAYVDFWAKGDTSRAKALLASVPKNYKGQFATFLAWMRWDINLMERNFAGAEEAVDSMPPDPVTYGYPPPTPKSYFRGCIQLVRGNTLAGLASFEEARSTWETELRAHPQDARLHAQIGLLYAFMGRKEDAIREGKRAVELMPVAKDAFDGVGVETVLALIYARTGENEKALALIKHLLSVPGALNYETSVTINDLRLRWQWDPLRKDAEFQKIINGAEPRTVF